MISLHVILQDCSITNEHTLQCATPNFTTWSLQAPASIHTGLILDQWRFYSNISTVTDAGVLTVVDNPQVLTLQQATNGGDVIEIVEDPSEIMIDITVSKVVMTHNGISFDVSGTVKLRQLRTRTRVTVFVNIKVLLLVRTHAMRFI